MVCRPRWGAAWGLVFFCGNLWCFNGFMRWNTTSAPYEAIAMWVTQAEIICRHHAILCVARIAADSVCSTPSPSLHPRNNYSVGARHFARRRICGSPALLGAHLRPHTQKHLGLLKRPQLTRLRNSWVETAFQTGLNLHAEGCLRHCSLHARRRRHARGPGWVVRRRRCGWAMGIRPIQGHGEPSGWGTPRCAAARAWPKEPPSVGGIQLGRWKNCPPVLSWSPWA